MNMDLLFIKSQKYLQTTEDYISQAGLQNNFIFNFRVVG